MLTEATPFAVLLSDTALVLAIRSGEKWASEALFQRYIGLAHRLARRVSRGRLEADDVAQDALLEAFHKLETLENPQAFAAWLIAIVTRRAGKHHRRDQMLLRLGFDSGSRHGVEAVVASTPTPEVFSELRAVGVLLSELPREERAVLLLRRVEEMELNEIARELKLSLATIKRRLARAGARIARECEVAPRSGGRRRQSAC